MPVRFWLPFLYVLLVLAPNNAYLAERVRLILINARPYAILLIVGGTLLAALREKVALRRYMRSVVHRRLVVLAGSFSTFYLLGSLFKLEFYPLTVILYALWTVTVFVAWPLLIRSHRDIEIWMVLLLVANGAAWLIPFLYSFVAAPVALHFRGIESYGYLNPDYSAQALQVVVSCILWFRHRRASWRWLARGLLVVAVVGTVLLNARNVLVFYFVTLVVYSLVKHSRRPGIAAIAFLVVVAVTGTVGSQYVAPNRMDEFSSGRITNWEQKFQRAFVGPNDAKAFLIGPDRLPKNPYPRSGYDPLRKEKALTKFHADNSILELFFEAGAIGLALFVWPYCLVVVLALRRLRLSRDRGAAWGVAVLIGIAAQSMFVTTIPTFANPVAFLFLTAVAIALGPSGASPRSGQP